jgi:Ras family protein T1
VLIVGNKSDCGDVMQDYILQPNAFCAKYKLPPPHSFSCVEKVNKEIYVKLATMAAFPYVPFSYFSFSNFVVKCPIMIRLDN